MGGLSNLKYRLCDCKKYGKGYYWCEVRELQCRCLRFLFCCLFCIFLFTFFSMSSTVDLLLPCNGTEINSVKEIEVLRDKYFELKDKITHISCCSERFFKTLAAWEKISNEYITKRHQLYFCFKENLASQMEALNQEEWLAISLALTTGIYIFSNLVFIEKFQHQIRKHDFLAYGFKEKMGFYFFGMGIAMSLITFFFPMISYLLGKELILETVLRYFETSDKNDLI